jgi:hypothetical protein
MIEDRVLTEDEVLAGLRAMDARAFSPDPDFPHVCANCGWGKEDHASPTRGCPQQCLCCGRHNCELG